MLNILASSRRLSTAIVLALCVVGGWGCATGAVCRVDAGTCDGGAVARIGPGEVGIAASWSARVAAGFTGN